MQTRMRHAKTMRTFDVDVFLRRGKQHSAVWWTFGKQPNAIHQLSVLQKKFAYDTFRCRRHFFLIWQWRQKNAANSFALTNKQPGNRVYSLPRRMPNNVQIYLHKRTHRIVWQHCYTERSVCVQSKVNRTRINMRNSWLVNMEKYGPEERAFIVEHFLQSVSYVVTICAYWSKFETASHKSVPTRKTVNNWVKNFRVSETIKKKKKRKEKTVRTPKNIQKVNCQPSPLHRHVTKVHLARIKKKTYVL